jgi:transcriptional regulator GlxA family with amidase domain
MIVDNTAGCAQWLKRQCSQDSGQGGEAPAGPATWWPWWRSTAWCSVTCRRHARPTADDTSIGRLLGWIEQHLSTDLSLPVIARRAAMSTRTLSRHFRAQVGAPPAEWIAGARVRRAQRMLETTDLAVERVATEAGFGSAAVMRQHFGEIVGTTPLAYRRAFCRASRHQI